MRYPLTSGIGSQTVRRPRADRPSVRIREASYSGRVRVDTARPRAAPSESTQIASEQGSVSGSGSRRHGHELGIGAERPGRVLHRGRGSGERMNRERSASERAAAEGVPVEMVPTTARKHLTGFAALNIPHAWRLGGDWHEAWFAVEPTRVSPHHLTDERRFGRLLDRLGQSGLRDARPGLARIGHPAGNWPEKVWAATHERAVIEMAWARLDGITAEDLPIGLPPVDRYARRERFHIDDFIEATASGRASAKRRRLDEILDVLESGGPLVLERALARRPLARPGRDNSRRAGAGRRRVRGDQGGDPDRRPARSPDEGDDDALRAVRGGRAGPELRADARGVGQGRPGPRAGSWGGRGARSECPGWTGRSRRSGGCWPWVCRRRWWRRRPACRGRRCTPSTARAGSRCRSRPGRCEPRSHLPGP